MNIQACFPVGLSSLISLQSKGLSRVFSNTTVQKHQFFGESPLDCKEIQPVLNIYWKDWCWSWMSNTLATWCEELTHWKRPWCLERLKAGGEEGDDRGWDGWMTSPTQCTWVWGSSRSWWWTRKTGVVQSMGLQRVRQDWVTELILYLFTIHWSVNVLCSGNWQRSTTQWNMHWKLEL